MFLCWHISVDVFLCANVFQADRFCIWPCGGTREVLISLSNNVPYQVKTFLFLFWTSLHLFTCLNLSVPRWMLWQRSSHVAGGWLNVAYDLRHQTFLHVGFRLLIGLQWLLMYNLSLQPASISAVEPDHLRSALVSFEQDTERTSGSFKLLTLWECVGRWLCFFESCLQSVARKKMSAYEVAAAEECGVTTVQTIVPQIYSSPKIWAWDSIRARAHHWSTQGLDS